MKQAILQVFLVLAFATSGSAQATTAPATTAQAANPIVKDIFTADPAALASQAGVLHAAERSRGVGDDALVEADHAGLELLADAERALDVALAGPALDLEVVAPRDSDAVLRSHRPAMQLGQMANEREAEALTSLGPIDAARTAKRIPAGLNT